SFWGWPTPNALTARTVLPPLPRQPVYGLAAPEEAPRFMREAKREKINLAWSAKLKLCRVAKGERPLSYSVSERTQAYVGSVCRVRPKGAEAGCAGTASSSPHAVGCRPGG